MLEGCTPYPEEFVREYISRGYWKDQTLGDLLEGIVLHAFDGRHPFGDETRRRIADLKRIYKLDLDADASHRLLEVEDRQTKAASKHARQKRKR